MKHRTSLFALSLVTLLAACDGSKSTDDSGDGGATDGGTGDGGTGDGGATDGGTSDGGTTDGGTTDGGTTDGGTTDGGTTDGGTTDGGTTDGGTIDGGTTDGGTTDGGISDGGTTDGGTSDGGTSDGGTGDGGTGDGGTTDGGSVGDGGSTGTTACVAVNDGDDYNDGTSMGGPGLLLGFRYEASEDVEVGRIELFTGEGSGMSELAIWSHDAGRNQPLAELTSGDWRLDVTNAWQGADLDECVTLSAGETYWIVWTPIGSEQASIQDTGTDVVYRGSFDGGVTWNGPYEEPWKFSLHCCE
ncbi:hypothetical protein L6R53_26535 [Myxococcota bacterium]|nr:hypothetical protein [Myxococcota bacterium]